MTPVAQPTPRPWKVIPDDDGCPMVVHETELGFEQIICDFVGLLEVQEANAALVVGACNSFDALTEANARLSERISQLTGDIKTASDVLQDFDGANIWQQAQAAVQRIADLEAKS